MRHAGALFTVIMAAVVSLGVVSLSDAERVDMETGPASHGAEPIIAPAIGSNLFQPVQLSGRRVDSRCISQDDVLAVFADDVRQVGGEIVVMTGGVQQNFSDYWRRTAGVDRIEVSIVLAHLVPNGEAEPIVDLAEFDEAGCAISRTLMAHGEWLELLRRSHGIEV